MQARIRSALVTGGAGFIGSHVAERLAQSGVKVVVLDDLSGGFADNVPAGAELVQGSVTDAALVERLVAQHRFEAVYHLAAYAAEGLSHFIRRFNYENNLLGSMSVVNACVRHKVRRLVFTSSIAVYGPNQLPMREDLTPCPEDPYGIAKLAVEQDLKAAHEMFGLEYAVLRPHNVFGERQNIGDPYRNVIGIFMNKVMQGQPLPVFGDGSQTRAFSYIDEVADVIVRSGWESGAANEIFNVGADVPVSVRDLAERISALFGVTPNLQFLPARKEVVHAYSDHAKVRRVFGEPRGVTVDEGLRRMAEWAKRQGARKGQPFRGIEILEGLPPSWKALSEAGG